MIDKLAVEGRRDHKPLAMSSRYAASCITQVSWAASELLLLLISSYLLTLYDLQHNPRRNTPAAGSLMTWQVHGGGCAGCHPHEQDAHCLLAVPKLQSHQAAHDTADLSLLWHNVLAQRQDACARSVALEAECHAISVCQQCALLAVPASF